MSNIEEYNHFLEMKKLKEAKKLQLEQEQAKIELANKNGYDTYRDYEYSVAKIVSRDPRFALNKEYYEKCQLYLIDTLRAYIHYIRTGDIYNRNNAEEGFVLTIYSLNELSSAILENNKLIISTIESMNINVEQFFNQISEPRVDVRKLKIN